MKWNVEHAQYLLMKPTIDQLLVSNPTVKSEVIVGSSLTEFLYNGKKPEKLRVVLNGTGQLVDDSGPNIVYGTRYLEQVENELILKAQNKTGKSEVEYVSVSLYYR